MSIGMARQRQERAKMRLLEHARFLEATVVSLKVISKEQAKADVLEAKERMKAEAARLFGIELERRIRASGPVYGLSDGDDFA